jgi:hypothetical protein
MYATSATERLNSCATAGSTNTSTKKSNASRVQPRKLATNALLAARPSSSPPLTTFTRRCRSSAPPARPHRFGLHIGRGQAAFLDGRRAQHVRVLALRTRRRFQGLADSATDRNVADPPDERYAAECAKCADCAREAPSDAPPETRLRRFSPPRHGRDHSRSGGAETSPSRGGCRALGPSRLPRRSVSTLGRRSVPAPPIKTREWRGCGTRATIRGSGRECSRSGRRASGGRRRS